MDAVVCGNALHVFPLDMPYGNLDVCYMPPWHATFAYITMDVVTNACYPAEDSHEL